ncbi:Uncharacterised protein at_DN2609 [Pycnogonum litorale]
MHQHFNIQSIGKPKDVQHALMTALEYESFLGKTMEPRRSGFRTRTAQATTDTSDDQGFEAMVEQVANLVVQKLQKSKSFGNERRQNGSCYRCKKMEHLKADCHVKFPETERSRIRKTRIDWRRGNSSLQQWSPEMAL